MPTPPLAIDRHVDRVGDGGGELEVEALLRAVAIHRREQDLAGAERRGRRRPLDGVDARRRAPAVEVDLEPLLTVRAWRRSRRRTHCDPNTVGDLGDQLGPLRRRPC